MIGGRQKQFIQTVDFPASLPLLWLVSDRDPSPDGPRAFLGSALGFGVQPRVVPKTGIWPSILRIATARLITDPHQEKPRESGGDFVR